MPSRDLKKYLLSPQDPIKQAIRVIDEGEIGIAMVVDEEAELLGVVTDSDVRKSILGGVSMEAAVERVMNRKPVVAPEKSSDDFILNLIRRSRKAQIPIVDENFHLRDIVTLTSLLSKDVRSTPAVIMAGGLGTRLRPLTEQQPKPLIKVGDKPILQTIIESLRNHGFRQFFLITNYRAELIEEYFGDGSALDVEIHYVKEPTRLGTAGGLPLLHDRLKEPFLLMNGDLLTKVNFTKLMEHHITRQAKFTVCVTEYKIQIPYGVVQVENGVVKQIDEKPDRWFFVNAGIYVFEPSLLEYIPAGEYFDMPMLLQELQRRKIEISCFPICEYWSDIGNVEQLEKSSKEYWMHFNH